MRFEFKMCYGEGSWYHRIQARFSVIYYADLPSYPFAPAKSAKSMSQVSIASQAEKLESAQCRSFCMFFLDK